jgi:hypothetical protein
MRKKKINLLDAYLELCLNNTKIKLHNGKMYGYWDINKGKCLSFGDFQKFIYKNYKTDNLYEGQLSFI